MISADDLKTLPRCNVIWDTNVSARMIEWCRFGEHVPWSAVEALIARAREQES